MSRIQHIEPLLRGILKNIPNTWYMKLQVNPLAHTKTPGDFLFLTTRSRYIIECKEQKTTNFPFSRLTQYNELLKFHNAHKSNMGVLAICFWKGSKKKSAFYLLGIDTMAGIITKSEKKSVNEQDLAQFRVKLDEMWTYFV